MKEEERRRSWRSDGGGPRPQCLEVILQIPAFVLSEMVATDGQSRGVMWAG